MKRNILIIGGMGPQASLSLHQRLIKCASELGARNGEDYPAITHLSLPIPDFISDQHRLREAIKIIEDSLYCLWPARV